MDTQGNRAACLFSQPVLFTLLELFREHVIEQAIIRHLNIRPFRSLSALIPICTCVVDSVRAAKKKDRQQDRRAIVNIRRSSPFVEQIKTL